jgi:hypothetical protein
MYLGHYLKLNKVERNNYNKKKSIMILIFTINTSFANIKKENFLLFLKTI